MPRIFDNIENDLLPHLRSTLSISQRADFCVGYFHLRGWKVIDDLVEKWHGDTGSQCRLLVGMQKHPFEELQDILTTDEATKSLDNQKAIKLKKKLAEEFRKQLTFGVPNNQDEAALRRLKKQLQAKKVVVKLFLKHTLHAKLYLCFREDHNNPITGYLGSSNLTFSGLKHQGELNVDVLDHDATQKLEKWFDDRWSDRWCIDITEELIQVIEESWALAEPTPYEVYVKIAYHLAQEARAGLSEFSIPSEFRGKLFDFQTAAVKIAAHHLNKRNGVLIGDVVGLGKTMMATALARVFQDDFYTDTLILCPKNLVPMWKHYKAEYRLLGEVLPISQAIRKLPEERRYKVVLIDESHNLRNREGKIYKAIRDYVQRNDSKCILLSATPYNKTYLDLSNQLRLFVEEDRDLGIRPENLLRSIGGEVEFSRRHQAPIRSLAAFEKSDFSDDWRELMRLYMVRRTRSFIQHNYAKKDPENGRSYLEFPDGTRSYFPIRAPKTIKFQLDEADTEDQYAKYYSDEVVDTINSLELPRYGLGNYISPDPKHPPTSTEAKHIGDLGRAGKRLMGFCRTNLFKRLESSGEAFHLSVERHIIRNHIFIHALENDLPIPLGTQDAGLLDPGNNDEDRDLEQSLPGVEETSSQATVDSYQGRAAQIYETYQGQYKRRFSYLRASLFIPDLKDHLQSDADALQKILEDCGAWNAEEDTKLSALVDFLKNKHPASKVLIFTQFADTVRYLEKNLMAADIDQIAAVTGDNENPTAVAQRFSPVSNGKRHSVKVDQELRVLIATDVLSEGQNLQDAAIVVNYDLPWAIIRLIQRAGRVDRIGQRADRILCCSFLPAEGVEKIIRLRSRVRSRLRENAEVVGADEAFFEDQKEKSNLLNLYNEKAGILDEEDDSDVDLSSHAYEIWKEAIEDNPSLKTKIPGLQDVVYSTKEHPASAAGPPGAIVYVRTTSGHDSLAWVNRERKIVTESQYEILKAAACKPDTPTLPRTEEHHDLVKAGVEFISAEEKNVGGALGRPSGARFKTYERLNRYYQSIKGDLFEPPQLKDAIEDIYRFPLRQAATDTLNRQLRAGITDETLAELVISFREGDKLSLKHQDEEKAGQPRLICSLGLSENP